MYVKFIKNRLEYVLKFQDKRILQILLFPFSIGNK